MIEVYIDGASAGNPGPSGIGILIKTNDGVTNEYAFPIENTNNHDAEFQALIKAMEICIENGYENVSLRTDSQLVDRALDRRYVKRKAFQYYLNRFFELEKHFTLFFVKWIPSLQNKKADQLARSAIKHNGSDI